MHQRPSPARRAPASRAKNRDAAVATDAVGRSPSPTASDIGNAGHRFGDYALAPPAATPQAHAAPAFVQPIQRNGFGDLSALVNAQMDEMMAPHRAREEQQRRQREKADLQRHFNVVADNFIGPKAQNTLTRTEFDNLADQYSNIRAGSTSIKLTDRTETLGGSPRTMSAEQHETFKTKTMGDIAKIMKTPIGRQLIGDLATGGKEVRIGETVNPLRAEAGAEDWAGAVDPTTGSHANVRYSSERKSTTDDFISTGDTTLFHELTHAHHITRGTTQPLDQTMGAFDPHLADPGDVGVRKEEYATVGLGAHANDAMTENAYRAQQLALQTTDAGRRAYAKRNKYTVNWAHAH